MPFLEASRRVTAEVEAEGDDPVHNKTRGLLRVATSSSPASSCYRDPSAAIALPYGWPLVAMHLVLKAWVPLITRVFTNRS